MSDPTPNQPDRLTRLEATVESIAGELSSLASTVKGLADQQGRPNYNALALVLTIIGGFGTIGYFAFEAAMGQIAAVETRSAMRHDELSRTIQKVEANAASETRDERQRNDRIERDLGRMEGFMAAKVGYAW